MAVIDIPRANDRRLTFSLASGATDAQTIFFTLKYRHDVTSNDSGALIAKTCTFTPSGDSLTGYVDLSHDETDIAELYYKYDFKLKYTTGKIANIESGLIRIKERVTVREA